MANQDDGLFLLEVLIDKIIYSKTPCFSDKAFRTCVCIKAPSCDPLELCDDDAGIDRIGPNDTPFVKSFNSGKSCLFSLKQAEIASAMSKFEIKVSVYKELPCGCLPTKISLGEATIDMTKEFVQARKSFLADPNNVSYQALKDNFHIKGADGVETGEILMFLRISCFGKLIITRFKGSSGPPMLGSGMGASGIVDRSCNPPRSTQSRDDPCACGAARGADGGSAAGSLRRDAGGVCDPARDPYSSMPCEDPEDPCYCTGPKSAAKQQMACRNTEEYCLHVPKGRNTLYEEIGTNLAGNELKIKVPAHASTIKKISQTHCAMQRPFVPQKSNDKQGSDPCKPPCAKNQVSLALPSEDVCCNGPQLAETKFTCTTEGCPLASKHNQPPPLQRAGTGDSLQNKDVFVLKVAKTAVQGDRKCRLELELVTPKGADQKPPVQKRDIRMQSDLDCECCVRRIQSLYDDCMTLSQNCADCCPPGNKVVFQMPQDTCGLNHKQRAHFSLTSDGVGDMTREDPAQLMPTTAEEYPGVVYDFSNRVIKLKIAKTVDGAGRKSKLEYQFITPVPNHEKVIPVHDNRGSQCVPTRRYCCGTPCHSCCR